MTLKSYLVFMSIATAICWGALAFVVGLVDPSRTNWLGFVLFYLSAFLAFSGSLAIVGFLLRFVWHKDELIFRSVRIAFHQSFFFAFFIVLMLFLSSRHLLTWLNFFLLAALALILEFFIVKRKNNSLN